MVLNSTHSTRLYDFSNDQLEQSVAHLQKEFALEKQTERLDLESPELLFREGLELFEDGTYQNCAAILRKAAKKFEQVTNLDPLHCQAWHAWGLSFAQLSILTGKTRDLEKAKNKIEKAALLTNKEHAAEIYWDAALIYQRLAEISGEQGDHYKSIAFFEKSAGIGQVLPYEFWNAFGKTAALLSEHLQDTHPILKAIASYKQAVNHFLANEEGWLGLAKNLQKLYFFTQDNNHFTQACDCYAAYLQLNPKHPEIWLERIAFMIEASQLKKDSAKLRSALEKCEQAAIVINEKTALLHMQGLWAEALALLGSWTSQVELIKEAEKKIDQALEEDEEDDPFLIHAYGKCLFSFASYYQDLDLYYQAIEEFQSSISIDRTQLPCWAWMGKTYAKIYECTEDIDPLEKALYFYSKALQIKSSPQFYYEIAALMIELGEIHHNPAFIEHAATYIEYLLQTYKSIKFEHPEWFYLYGIALDIQGEIHDEPVFLRGALEAFVTTLMFDPNHPKIHHRMAVVYSHLGESLDDIDHFYKAIHHFKLAQDADQENEALMIDWGLTWIHLALLASDSTTQENCFREAEQKFIQAAKLGNETVYYQLACLYSLQGYYDLSFFYLHKSYATKNLPPRDELEEDDWLEGVRLFPQFEELLALLPEN